MQIRDAKREDVPAIHRMMKDFADFEDLGRFFETTEEKLNDALFGPAAVAEAMVAEVEGSIAAYALFFPCFASFRGQKGYHLEDLFVDQAFRGRGIGEALMRRVAAKALRRGFERIDFQVLDWNDLAIGFYEKLGAARDGSERHFKFTDEAFRVIAEG